jgi:hypothetical protein
MLRCGTRSRDLGAAVVQHAASGTDRPLDPVQMATGSVVKVISRACTANLPKLDVDEGTCVAKRRAQGLALRSEARAKRLKVRFLCNSWLVVGPLGGRVAR